MLRRRRRFRRSPTTRSSPTATPVRWSRRRGGRLALRARLRRAERLRQPARPGGGILAPRAVRHQPSRRARLRAGNERARDDVEDAVRLDRGPGRADDGAEGPRGRDHAAHQAAGRRRRRPHARADRRVHRRPGRGRARLRAGLRLRPRRPRNGRSSTTAGTRPTPPAPARRSASSRISRWASRETASAHGTCSSAGERALLRALLGRGARRPAGRRRGRRRGSPPRRASGAAGSARARIPDHRWRDPIQRSALTIKGLTYMPTGATVAALTTSLPETPGGERNWDYRYTWMRDTTFTLQALHYLNLDWEADEFMQFVADLEPNEDGVAADHVRDRRPSRPDRVDARRPHRLRRRPAGAHRQRRLRPAPERRLRRRARLDPAPHPAERAPAAAALADRRSRRRSAPRRSGASPTRASGRRAASRSTTSRRSSCAGSRSTAPPSWPRSAATRQAAGDVARDGGRDPRRHPRARRQRARRPPPALRDRLARRLDAAGGDLRVPARRRRAAARDRRSRSPRS